MSAYYNEHDPYAAQWLRNLISAGHIAPGVVDERDIRTIKPSELERYTQCHFFAGVGVWSYALRQAGWSDDRPVWTGSCPCQPFSNAGRGTGFTDERHLWPHWFHLIEACNPSIIFGEQVASKDGLGWLDLVQTDMEGAGYANGAVDLCAAGVGAPHIRQRLWFAAERLGDAERTGLERHLRDVNGAERWQDKNRSNIAAGVHGGMADPSSDRQQRQGQAAEIEERRQPGSDSTGQLPGGLEGRAAPDIRAAADIRDQPEQPGPTNGFWRDVDWLFCRDEKWRPVEPGTFPLAHGAANRVGRLRAFGNAINAEAAQTFIEAYMQ